MEFAISVIEAMACELNQSKYDNYSEFLQYARQYRNYQGGIKIIYLLVG